MPRKAEITAPTPMRLWAPFLFWLVLIFAFSSYPKAIIPQSKYIAWDKLAHMIEFGILGYLTARALRFSGFRAWSGRYAWITVSFGLVYAISDEFHQLYVKGRNASGYDVAADFVGVVVGVLLFAFLMRRRSRLSSAG